MNLKKELIASCVALGLQTAGFAQQNFVYEISGKIPGAEKIFLAADPYEREILDSAKNIDGSFVFRGKAKSISMGSIIVEAKSQMFPRYFNIFIEPGKIKVKPYEGGFQLEVRGSRNNDIMTTVESENKAFWTGVSIMYDSLNYASMKMSILREADVVNKDSIAYYQAIQVRMQAEAAPLTNARNEKLKAAFKKYPNTFFTAYIALNSPLSDETLKGIYAGFDAQIKNSVIGKDWHKQLFDPKQLEEGSIAPDFSVTDVNGKQVKLSDMRGKYILLDFWATWCGPCRAGNPHLISLYKQYKPDGLEIIGISDDDKNVAGWKKAIKDDGIGIWLQVLRNREKKNANGESLDMSYMYKVESYPTKILIDRDGKVVRQFADDNELDALLSEIFKKG